MNKLEKILSKWNFKKIAVVYIIIAVLVLIGCTTATGILFRDRIAFAWQYSVIGEEIEKSGTENLKGDLDKLAASSPDVVDILMLDNGNNVIYSVNHSAFAEGTFTLTGISDKNNYLVSEKNDDVVFKFVKDEDFMLASVFNNSFGDILNEYDNEYFYEHGFFDKTVYMLSYIGEKDSGSKIYIISNPTSVPGGTFILKLDACLGMLLFMVYWVLLALWAYRDAARAKLYPQLWGVIVLLTNLVGVLIYELYKRGNTVCPDCGASQNKNHIYCVFCGAKLGETCEVCGAHLCSKDCYCSHCGVKIK